MGMSINTNIPAVEAQRQTSAVSRRLLQGFQQLASGLQINRAADNAAGLAISEQMRAEVRQYTQEANNLQMGVNVVQTAETALGTQGEGLQRLRELAVQAANGTLTAEQRTALNQEAQQIVGQIGETAQSTQFNGVALLNGGAANLQLGTEGGTMQVNIATSTPATLGITGLDLTTQAGATNAINTIDTAANRISQNRASLGAQQNRFAEGIATREMAAENTQAAESRIRDVDYARQMIEQNRNQLLAQAGTAVLGQANLQGQNVARLLGA